MTNMTEIIREYTAPPQFFSTSEQKLAGRMLNAILIALQISTLLVLVISRFYFAENIRTFVIILCPIVFVGIIYLRRLMFAGKIRLTGWIVCSTVMLNQTVAFFLFSGLRDNNVSYFLVFIMVAGLTLGRQGVVVFGTYTVIISFVLYYAEHWGYLIDVPTPSIEIYHLAPFVTGVVLFATLLYLAVGSISEAFSQERVAQKAFKDSNKQLKNQIAKRQTVEDALRLSESHNRQLIENITGGIIQVAPDYHIQFVNDNFCHLTGFTEAELLGKPLTLFLEEDSFATIQQQQQERRRGLEGQYEICIAHRLGHNIWLLVNGKPILDEAGNFIGTQAVCYDVTERKKAEQALQKSEQRYRTLFEYTHDAIVLADLDGVIFDLNQQVVEMLGGKIEDFVQQPFWRFIADNEKDLALANQSSVVAGNRIPTFERNLKRLDGSTFPVEITATLIRDKDGNPLYAQSAIRDVTERKKAELALKNSLAELAKAHDVLEVRVTERTVELVQANQDLETMLYVMSHDLKEPLRAIQNFSQLINHRYSHQLDEKGQDYLFRVIRASDRLYTLLDGILVLSRVQRMELTFEPIASETMVQDVLNTLEDVIQSKQAIITVAGDLPILQVNRTLATQAIYNLVNNALKFTEDGERPKIEIETFDDGEFAGIIVRDYGLGINPDHQKRIFQLFQRAVGREIEGTGAGLAIVKQIVKRHQGKIWVNSQLNEGAEFTIVFPVAQSTKSELVNHDEPNRAGVFV